jgi:hypothetical protein
MPSNENGPKCAHTNQPEQYPDWLAQVAAQEPADHLLDWARNTHPLPSRIVAAGSSAGPKVVVQTNSAGRLSLRLEGSYERGDS